MAISTIITTFRWLLEPTSSLKWLGYDITTLDLVAALRLCVVLRQLRDASAKAHVSAVHHEHVRKRERELLVKNIATTLIVVYGGEAVVCEFFCVCSWPLHVYCFLS